MKKLEYKKGLESNIWKYYIYQFFAGFWLISPILVIFYLANNTNYLQLGSIESIGLLALILFEIPSGAFADIVGRKTSMFLGLLLASTELLLIGYGANYLAFMIAAFLGGIGGSLISGADTSLLYDSLKEIKKEKLFQKIKGRANAITYFSVVIASLLGSFIYAKNNALVFYINGFIFILGGLFCIMFKEPRLDSIKFNLKNQFKHIKDSFSYLFKTKKLLWFSLFSIVSGGFISLFHNILVQPYFEWLGYDIAIFGILVATIFIIRSVVSLISYSIEQKLGEKLSLYIIVVLQAIFFFVMAYLNALWLFLLVVLLYSVWSYQEIIMDNYMHQHMNSKQRATLHSISSFFKSIIMIIAFMAFGYIIDITSIAFSMYVLSFGSLILGLSFLLGVRK